MTKRDVSGHEGRRFIPGEIPRTPLKHKQSPGKFHTDSFFPGNSGRQQVSVRIPFPFVSETEFAELYFHVPNFVISTGMNLCSVQFIY
jgi:hypothetical protein